MECGENVDKLEMDVEMWISCVDKWKENVEKWKTMWISIRGLGKCVRRGVSGGAT